MDIASITSQLRPADLGQLADSTGNQDPAKLAKASKQFECILLRQILGESMKPLLQGGPSGQVYGYMLTDSLANQISDGGGLGLAHVLQTQLSQKHK
jgi:flagellar protein FlgJ